MHRAMSVCALPYADTNTRKRVFAIETHTVDLIVDVYGVSLLARGFIGSDVSYTVTLVLV